MSPHFFRLGTAFLIGIGAPGFGIAAHATTPPSPVPIPEPVKYRNCPLLQADYPHGVAGIDGVDLVRGAGKPVTTFVVDDAVYRFNTHLDRDRDAVACEKR